MPAALFDTKSDMWADQRDLRGSYFYHVSYSEVANKNHRLIHSTVVCAQEIFSLVTHHV